MNTINISEKALNLYQQALLCDLMMGFEPEIEVSYKWDVLDRYSKAGFNYVSLAVATDATSLEKTVQYIAAQTAHINSAPDKYLLVKKPEDILRAKAENKLAVGFMFQGTNPLHKDFNMIDLYYQLGVRSMILAYNIRNPMGDGVSEAHDAGLSNLGKNLIKKMNQTGMLVDLSHTGYKTGMEAMELSEQPVIFSHSNAYNVYAHPRNLKDDQLKAVAASGGVIGINGLSGILGDDNNSLQNYIRHIDYIAQLIGVKHISLGTDLIYFPEIFDEFMKNNAIFYSNHYTKAFRPITEWNNIQPEQIIEIVELLLQRGYSDADIKGILGENYLRVIKQVWR